MTLGAGFVAASFRGVPFQWFDVQGQHGVRGPEHEFPKRNTPYGEPLGRGARQFTINACTIGANYAANRDALIAACEVSAPGLLVHPTQPQIRVWVPKGGCLYREDTKKQGVAFFTITFNEAGSRAAAVTVSANTQAASANAAEAALTAAQSGFTAGFQVTGGSFIGAAAQSNTASLFGMMQALSNSVSSLPLAAFAFAGAAAASVAGAAALVAAPASLAAAVVAQVRALPLLPGLAIGAVRTAIVGPLSASDPTDAVALAVNCLVTDAPGSGVTYPDADTAVADAIPVALALGAIDPSLTLAIGAPAPGRAYTAPTGLTPGMQTIAINQALLLALTRQAALAMACKLIAQADYTSYQDAVAARDDLAARLDAEILVAADAGVRRALRALRIAAVTDLSQRAVQLPRLIAYTPATTLPARVIAHRIYDDPAYAADIVARNDIEAPGFVPGGVALKVLTNAAYVTLTVGGKDYGGWETVIIDRNFEAGAGAFTVGLSERWPGSQAKWEIPPGSSCTLAIDGEIVITGHTDDYEPGYDPDTHEVQVLGRDATGDLVDCSAVPPPNEFSGMSLLAIADILCKPFGIPVSATAPIGAPFSTIPFRIHMGESVWEAVERGARHRSVMPVSDSKGGLVFQQAGDNGSHAPLRLGQNLKSGRARHSWRQRFSQVIVMTQTPGSDLMTPAQAAGITGYAFDPNITRYRPLIVMSEASDPGTLFLTQRAQWEVNVRAGRGKRGEPLRVVGWRDDGGTLWQPNRTVSVTDDFLDFSETLLVTGARMILNDTDGEVTDLTLMPPAAFLPQPLGRYPDFDL